jgi:hypothetical protein
MSEHCAVCGAPIPEVGEHYPPGWHLAAPGHAPFSGDPAAPHEALQAVQHAYALLAPMVDDEAMDAITLELADVQGCLWEAETRLRHVLAVLPVDGEVPTSAIAEHGATDEVKVYT